MFLANYSDGLTDLDLPAYIEHFRSRDRVASFLVGAADPHLPRRAVDDGRPGRRRSSPSCESDVWINGGFFVVPSRRSSTTSATGEDLVVRAVPAPDRRRAAHRATGTRASGAMDTFKDKQQLDDMYARARALGGLEAGGGRRRPARCFSLGLSTRFAARDCSTRPAASAPTRDDIEIGCGGTMLRSLEAQPAARGRLGGASADGSARGEAQRERGRFLGGAPSARRQRRELPRALLPVRRRRDQGVLRRARPSVTPTIVFTHRAEDLHQDHGSSRADLAHVPQHLILEYEIPKFDGDLGQPNFFVPLDERLCEQKVDYSRSTSRASATSTGSPRRRSGRSCASGESSRRSPSGHAEAFHCRKLVVG